MAQVLSTQGRLRWKQVAQFTAAVAVLIALGMGADPLVERWRRAHEPAGWQRFRPPHETAALLLVGDRLWAGGRDGLALFDWRAQQLLALPAGVPHLERVRSLLLDHSDNLWVAHAHGVERCMERCANPQWQHFDTPLGAVEAVVERANGELWAGGEHGLARLTGNGFALQRSSADLGMAGVFVLLEDHEGNLWLGAVDPVRGGLVRRSPSGVWTDFAHNGLAHPSVAAIFQDEQGALWFASGFGTRGGACRWLQQSWMCLGQRDGLTSDRARLIFKDHTGRLWIGSETQGLALQSKAGWRWLTPDQGMTGWEVKRIVETPDGSFWLGTEDGVTRISAAALTD